ncbi:MAG TPA: CdaR family protein [Dehalococcoidia bacterium]|nr:CdaR family protein [Dehalococcoidia bacterium]
MSELRRLPHALAVLARGAVTSVAGNLSLAVLAVALAVTLWLYVSDKENPKQVETFNSAIPIEFVNVPNGLAVANSSETAVRIQVEGTKADLKRLNADDFKATVNLGGFQEGVQNVSVDVAPPNSNVDVTDVSPGRIDVTLEESRTKEVPVKVALVGSPQSGFVAGNAQADPQTVTVTGAESLIALVDSAVAEINVTRARVDLDETVNLHPRDVNNGEISRVTANPDKSHVTVDIEQREFSNTFIVNPVIRGEPAAGYNVTGVSADPRIVTVSGPVEVLQSIDAVRGIATEEISIADQRSDVVRQVDLVLPPGASVQGTSAVNVRISIAPAQGQYSYTVVPEVRNTGSGLHATAAQAVITVTLAGDVPALQSITPDAIAASVDAGGLGAGLYTLNVSVTPPPGTSLVRVDPPQLGVALGPAP